MPDEIQVGANPSEILDQAINAAIESRASDIHFEPERDGFGVRFRIDGLLHPIQTLGKYSQDQLISRIKILSQIDITEHRFPQDGHFEFPYGNRIYNIRVSTMPSTYGETVVFRIHNREDVLIELDTIGLEPEQLELLNNLIHSPSGIIMVTGPTGSGKTNLLYAILHSLNKVEKNIISLENPVEYQMENIRQTEISETVGMTFAKGMRAILRQDPDIIMLGEIRDPETALMAFQAALTGILILTTFHTFDIPALVNRLNEMGVPNSILAQVIKGVVITRLVRKICPSCKVAKPLSDEQKKLFPELAEQAFYAGTGCDACKKMGYVGRVGIYEIIHFEEDLRLAIIEGRSPAKISELIKGKKFISLKDTAIKKALAGTTSMDEVVRVLGYLNEEKR